MGLISITPGGIVAPTSLEEVTSPVSTTRGGVSTLESTIGVDVALLSIAPRGRVAVRASSASASPTTFDSVDLVRDGEAGHPGRPVVPPPACKSATPHQHKNSTAREKD
jgi:hypothetical protein